MLSVNVQRFDSGTSAMKGLPMNRFLPAAFSILLAFSGCATFDTLLQPTTQPATTAAPSSPSAVAPPAVTVVPQPTDVQILAKGLVEALARGDVAQARMFYLSDEEFDALFSWSGPDPRPERNARIDAAIRAAAAQLQGATFQGLASPPSKPADFNQGRRFTNLILERPTSAVDAVSALATVNGQIRTVRLEGPIRVGNIWRLYSPTLEVK
jgi:hypothetical protein